MRKTIIVFLLFSFVFSLAGCSDDVNTEGLLPELELLMEESKHLNEIYFGEGIPVKEGGISAGIYKEADTASLLAEGFTDIQSIKNATEQVFSSSMCAWLYKRAFAPFSTGTTVIGVRYYEDADKRLMVRTRKEEDILLDGEVTYDYSSAKVVKKHKKQVRVSMKATVVTKEGKTRTDQINVDVLLTKNGWRLNSPTYFAYD